MAEDENEVDDYTFDEVQEKKQDSLRLETKLAESVVNGAAIELEPLHGSSSPIKRERKNKRGSVFAKLLGNQANAHGVTSKHNVSDGYDEEAQVIVPEVITPHGPVRARRASAVPMTSYVAVSVHAQPESVGASSAGQDNAVLNPDEKPSSSSNLHASIKSDIGTKRSADNITAADGTLRPISGISGNKPPRRVSGLSTMSSITVASQNSVGVASDYSRSRRPSTRRTSFFGGIITGMGENARRQSRAQSNLFDLNDDIQSELEEKPASVADIKLDAVWIEKLTIDGLPYFWNRRTKEVRFEKPSELKTADEKEMDTDDWTWVPHKTKCWQPAQVLKRQKNGEVLVKVLKTGNSLTIPPNRMVDGVHVPLWPLKQSSLFIAEDDLVALDDPNEGLIMHTIRARYKADQIYTYVGASRTVLISMNPYKTLEIYTLDEIEAQQRKGPNKQPPPHVFAIANDALETLRWHNSNAAILISGESGAGKTEATKQCLGFLAEVAGSSNNVERKILVANPVLEAFGNAKTLRNNNSSRFGKWIEVRFDPDSREISGAKITPFLLERSRLVFQQLGERNFHVFYQMCASEKVRKECSLGNPSEFRYLNQSNCISLPSVDDSLELERTIASMSELGFSDVEQKWIFKISAAALHLGNIDFIANNAAAAAAAADAGSGNNHSANNNRLLSIPPTFSATRHEPSLETKTMTSENSSKSLTSQGSMERLKIQKETDDSNPEKKPGCSIADLPRTAGKRFQGTILSPPPTTSNVGSSLPQNIAEDDDEDGSNLFTSFAPRTGRGSLQAAASCLGISVEGLGQVLCQRSITVRKEVHVIPLSAEEARNGCDSLAMAVYGRLFSWIVNRVNVAVCSSINKGKFVGILDIFGFEIFEKNSFEQLCINFTNEKLQQHFNTTMFKEEEGLYIFEGVRFQKVEFVDNQPVLDIVEGKPNGILLLLDDECKAPGGSDDRLVSKIEKIHGKHPRFRLDTKKKLVDSTGFEIIHYAGAVRYDSHGFVAANTDTLYPDMYDICSRSSEALTTEIFPPLPENERLRLKTIGAHFRGQLNELIDILKTTESRYIRCIKPNGKQEPNSFDSHLTLEQLRYSGVFDAVQIRKRGFPFRWNHRQFAYQYRCINEGYKYTSNADDFKAQCEEILRASPQNFKGVQIGKTRVLYRAEHHKVLLLLRNLAVDKILPWLQARFRSCLARMIHKSLIEATQNIQNAIEDADIDTIDEALDNYKETLGDLGKKLFPWIEPNNIGKANTLKQGLKDWIALEEELEALENDRREPAEKYFDMVLAVHKAEKLKDIPATRSQERQLDTIKDMVEHCTLSKMDQEAADALKSHNREEMHRLLKEYKGRASHALDSIRLELEEMAAIELRAKEALSVLSREDMTKALEDASRYNMSGPVLDEIKSMFQLREHDFVKKELDIAIKMDDIRRIHHRELRLKDIHLEEHASDYQPFESYKAFRPRAEFAAADFKTMFFGKSKVMARMFEWQSGSIPTSLIDFTKLPVAEGQGPLSKPLELQLKKLAIHAFKLTRAYMGDIKDELVSRNPDEAARRLVLLSREEPAMSGEIYAQLMKQLTKNPRPESITRGQELLAFFCAAVYPPDDFDNFIMIWIKAYFAEKPAILKKYLATIHTRFFTPVTVPVKVMSRYRSEFQARVHSRHSLQPGQSSGPTPPQLQIHENVEELEDGDDTDNVSSKE